MEEVSQEWVVKTGEAWAFSDKEGLEYTLAQNNEVIKITGEESKRWIKAVSPVITDYVTRTSEKGLPAQEYVDFIQNSIRSE